MKDAFGVRFVVEFGSSYSDDPWEIVCVCESQEVAEAYINNQDRPRSMYHVSTVPYFANAWIGE